jgi:hypothetical protein
LFTKLLMSFGSAMSIGFGLWHFLVPRVWNWYSYIYESATELVLAVRAIKVFFSLSLVLGATWLRCFACCCLTSAEQHADNGR